MAALEVAVLIPWLKAAGGVVKLDEAHAALHQAARQQALPAEGFRVFLIDAVEPLRRLGFAGQVEGVGRLHLHAVGQLKGFDASAQPAVLGTLRAVQVVEAAKGVQLEALPVRAHTVVLEVADRILQVGDKSSLERGRQEAGAVLAGAFDQGPWTDGDEPGQVLVLGTQAVGHPGAQAGPGSHPLAGVHLQTAARMVHVVRHHRANDAELIAACSDVRE